MDSKVIMAPPALLVLPASQDATCVLLKSIMDIPATTDAPATASAAAPAAVPAPTPKPLKPDPNCGHQPTERWLNKFTAVTYMGTFSLNFRRHNNNKWRVWDPENPQTLGK
jgi:hypothetical protein